MPENKVQIIITTDATGAVTGISQATGAMQKMESETGGIVSKIKQHWLGLTVAITGAMIMVNKGLQYMELGARAKQAEESFRTVTASFHINAEKMLSDMRRVSAGIIDDSDMMQKAVQGMMMGLKGDQIVKLLEVSRLATRVWGQDAKDTFDTVVTAVGGGVRAMGPLVRMGLVTKEEFEKLNKALAAGVENINLYDLVMAHAVLQQAAFKGVTGNASEALQRFHATVTEVKEVLGKIGIEVLPKIWGGFNVCAAAILIFAAGFFKANEAIATFLSLAPGPLHEVFQQIAKDSKESAKTAMDAANEIATTGAKFLGALPMDKPVEKLGMSVEEADKKIKAFMANLEKQIALKEAQKNAEKLAKQYDDLKDAVRDFETGIIDLNPALDETDQKFIKWDANFDKLVDTINESKISKTLKEQLIDQALQIWGEGFDLISASEIIEQNDKWREFWQEVENTSKTSLQKELDDVDKWAVENAELFQKNWDRVLKIVEAGEIKKSQIINEHAIADQKNYLESMEALPPAFEEATKVTEIWGETTKEHLSRIVEKQKEWLPLLEAAKTQLEKEGYTGTNAYNAISNAIQQINNDQRELNKTFSEGVDAGMKEYLETLNWGYDKGKQITGDAMEGIQHIIEDTLLGKMKLSWKAALDWMYSLFAKFIAQIATKALAEKIVIPIVAQITGTGVAQAATGVTTGAATGTGGVGDLFSSLSSLSSLITDFGGMLLGSMSSYEDFMVAFPDILGDEMFNAFSSALGTITPYLPLLGPIAAALTGNYGGAIGGAVGFGGSLLLGASLGSIVPGIGTLVGGIIGTLIGSLFGGNEPEPRIKIDWKGFFNVEDQDIELGKAQKTIEKKFTEIRQVLLDFAETIGLDTSKFYKEWSSKWKKLKDKDDVKNAINEWIAQYARWVTGIKFGKFKKEGEKIVETIDRIITSILVFPDVIKSFGDYIAAIEDSYDAIAKWKDQMMEADEQIDSLKKSLSKATDPTDAINYANELKQAIYEKYLAEKQLIESLLSNIEELQKASLDFQIDLQQKLDELLGTFKSISVVGDAMATSLSKMDKAKIPSEKMNYLQEYIGYLDQWVDENIKAIEDQYSTQKDALNEQLKIAQQWKDVLKSVDDQLLGMKTGTASPETVYERMDYLRSEMEKVRNLYLGSTGEERAGYASQLQNLIASYVGMAQEAYQRPSSEYQAIYDEMTGWLEAIKTDAQTYADSEEDLLKQINDIDTHMAEDIKAFKESAATYYEWAMAEGISLYQEAIADQTEKLSQLLGDKTVEQYLADLQLAAVTELVEIRDLLDKVFHTLLPNLPAGYGGEIVSGVFKEPAGYQTGGYVPRKTLAWLGEREPEWIIPESKMNQFANQTITIAPNITIQTSGNVDERKIAKATEEAIIYSFKHGKGRQVLKEAMQHK